MGHKLVDRMLLGGDMLGDAPGGLNSLKVLETLTFTTSQTYVIPDGVVAIRAALGGGGGQGGAGTNGGLGGAGFIAATTLYPVNGGDILTIVLGGSNGNSILSVNGVEIIVAQAGERGYRTSELVGSWVDGGSGGTSFTGYASGRGGAGSRGGVGGAAINGSAGAWPLVYVAGSAGLSVPCALLEQWWDNDLPGAGGTVGAGTLARNNLGSTGGGNPGGSGKAQIQLLGY